MKLINKSQKSEVCSEVKIAQTFLDRAIGLIGTKNFSDRALFFPGERWPHTFFMSIPIDVVYLNKAMEIVKISTLQPWRMTLPVLSASNILELPAGLAEQKKLKLGDQLHVGN